MGHGSYTAGDWAKLKVSRKIDSDTTEQIFESRKMDPRFDPRYIDKRESRDSEDHPCSTPIIIGVDVTGSMGYLSTQIIKESLNDLMLRLYSSDLIRDPQLLFAAIGDAPKDQAPLQVTQFESDIRIAEQLLGLWIENEGGDAPEDYELAWYFASRHTDTDCYRKRGEKGFCFTIGDADCHDSLRSRDILRIFGDKCAEPELASRALAEEAAEKYELFHIRIGDAVGNFGSILPGRTLRIPKSGVRYLPEILISAMQIAKGGKPEKVIAQWGELARAVVGDAVKLLCIGNTGSITF